MAGADVATQERELTGRFGEPREWEREEFEVQLWDMDSRWNGGSPVASETVVIDTAERETLFQDIRELAARAAERYAARLRAQAPPKIETPSPTCAPRIAAGSESDEPRGQPAAGGCMVDWREMLSARIWDRSLMNAIPPPVEIIHKIRTKLRSAVGELTALKDAVDEGSDIFNGNDIDEFPEQLAFLEADRRASRLSDELAEVDEHLSQFKLAFGHARMQELDGVTWERAKALCAHVPELLPCAPLTVLMAAIGHLARADDPGAIIAEFERERIGQPAPRNPGDIGHWPWIPAERFEVATAAKPGNGKHKA